MNGKTQVQAMAKLLNSDQNAPADALWPPSKLKPGDKVRIGTRLDILIVEHVGDPLITLRHPSGATLKAGWKAIKKIQVDDRD